VAKESALNVGAHYVVIFRTWGQCYDQRWCKNDQKWHPTYHKKKEFLFQNIDITFVHILKKRLKCGEFRVCFSIPFEYAYTFNLTMFVCNIKNFAQDKMDAALSRLICSTVTNSSLKQFRPENELNPICLLKRSAGFKTALTETS
jgi:hypothetical protein